MKKTIQTLNIFLIALISLGFGLYICFYQASVDNIDLSSRSNSRELQKLGLSLQTANVYKDLNSGNFHKLMEEHQGDLHNDSQIMARINMETNQTKSKSQLGPYASFGAGKEKLNFSNFSSRAGQSHSDAYSFMSYSPYGDKYLNKVKAVNDMRTLLNDFDPRELPALIKYPQWNFSQYDNRSEGTL